MILAGKELSAPDYIELDDISVLYCLKQWESSDDKTLGALATSFRRRRLPKAVFTLEHDEQEDALDVKFQLACDVAQRRGEDPEYSVWLDRCTDIPYEEQEQPSPADVWLQMRPGQLSRLSDQSIVLHALRNRPLTVSRIMCIEPLRKDITRALSSAEC